MDSYGWPGNIRELRNVIERSIITSSNSTLQLVDELLIKDQPTTPALASNASLDEVQRLHILAILEKTDWKIEGSKGAAQILQLKPSTLRHRMKKLGIKRQTEGF
jgi:transcriptional regulator with GAF, ATPase, and Fis domain